ncbi:MAG: DUF4912 domain-containing protein [Pirellulales bacterium]
MWADKNLAPQGRGEEYQVAGSKPVALQSKWPTKDRLVVMVRGPFWLHATWDLTPAGVQRAQAALGQDWHAAKPILRLLTLSTHASSTSSERVARNIPIHGGVKNWFIDVNNPPQSFRLEIGYLTASGRFFCLARSNTVTTPPPQVGDSLDTHWGDISMDCEKIYALSGGNGEGGNELTELFEEKLQRPVGLAAANAHSSLAAEGLIPRDKNFRCEIEAEIVLKGTTLPGANVTIQGEPIKTHPDGTFSANGLPESSAGDSDSGVQQRRRPTTYRRAGHRTQHQGDGTATPRIDRRVIAQRESRTHSRPARSTIAQGVFVRRFSCVRFSFLGDSV